jgi:hypothetical protein
MEWKPKRHRVPSAFVNAVANGYDYDSTNTEAENRQRAEEGGFFGIELIGEEVFEEWRDRGKKLYLDEAEHHWALGDWIVEGEDLKEIAISTRNQQFKHAVYSFAAEITGFNLNLIFAEVCERDGRFAKPVRRTFDLKLDLSPQAQDLLIEEFGATGKEKQRNLYPDIIGE